MAILDLAEKEKIINLDERPRSIFVGDTHGDLEASQKVWEHYSDEVENEEAYLVFLGDYVDRGAQSKENIDFLLRKKESYPKGLILLLGNHDAYHLRNLMPADFWQSLSTKEYEYYRDLMYLPWIANSEGLVAAHGCLPFIPDFEALREPPENIFERENDLDIPIWVSVTWGDLNRRVSGIQMDALTGRPQFGKEIIMKYMQKHDWNVLIRAHQPGMQGWSFAKNVLTIFTSQAYVQMGRARERNVAEVDLECGVRSFDDVEVLSLDQL